MQKKFGQNFLIDAHVPEKIVAAADITGTDFVIEIGPGIGTLTQYLCQAAGSVATVEIDRHLLPVLEETLADWDNVEVISGDVMKLDLAALIEAKTAELAAALQAGAGGITGEPAEAGAAEPAVSDAGASSVSVKVVANLPYYITTPILMKLLEEELPIDSITVMIQKEVADRMQAAPGTAAYGALSLAVQYYAEPKLSAIVPPNCFVPRPNVESAVIHLARRAPAERIQVQDSGKMFAIIKAAFAQRRKTLVNALRNAADLRKEDGTSYSREEAEQALTACGFPLTIRGEALGLQEFAKLSDIL
ncbi:MAG: 16S rRNA (adenine(1518)-N(6)/adenine(1519)-N(6))-dimethyltransferase [Eubacterium sp.]|nr:16S rRNA (adenine(1518)-N(6)/adenine(1519)-N(6))-dimethyltransferase [Eubacterium sp.]